MLTRRNEQETVIDVIRNAQTRDMSVTVQNGTASAQHTHYGVPNNRSEHFQKNVWYTIVKYIVDTAKVLQSQNFCIAGEQDPEALTKSKRINRMLFTVHRQLDESFVYIAMTSPRDTTNMFKAMLIPHTFKIIVRENVLIPSDALCT